MRDRPNYLRDWKLVVTPYTRDLQGKKYLIASAQRTLTDLKMTFKVRITNLGDPLLGTFRIHNVAPETEYLFTSGLCNVELWTGWYGREPDLLFSGEISNSYQIRQGTELIWNLWVRDTGNNLEQFYPSNPEAGWPEFVSIKQILEDLVNQTPDIASLEAFDTAASVILAVETDFTYTDNVRSELTGLLKSLDLGWAVANGVLTVFDMSGTSLGAASDPEGNILVSVRTGLLSRPKLDWVGIEFDHVLDSRFRLGKMLRIDANTVQFDFGNEFYVPLDKRREARLDGDFRIMEITHEGDTRGDMWKSHINAFSSYAVKTPTSTSSTGPLEGSS